jgi:hypothetical protein
MEVEILTTVNEWYIDIDSILAFCGSGNGFVHTWYNQYTGGNNAVQINNGYQPQIISNGLFSYDGLKFTTAANTALRIIKYSSMNIVDEPASFYLNGLINNTIGSQWFLAVNTSLATDIQFGLLRTNEYLRFVKGSYDTIITNEAKTQGSTFKNLWVWENKNVNGFSSQPSGTLGTINTQLTSRDNVYIGARSASADGNTSAGSLDGKIKTLVVLNSLSDYNLMSNY